MTIAGGSSIALLNLIAELEDHDIVREVDGSFVLRVGADVVDAALAVQ